MNEKRNILRNFEWIVKLRISPFIKNSGVISDFEKFCLSDIDVLALQKLSINDIRGMKLKVNSQFRAFFHNLMKNGVIVQNGSTFRQGTAYDTYRLKDIDNYIETKWEGLIKYSAVFFREKSWGYILKHVIK